MVAAPGVPGTRSTQGFRNSRVGEYVSFRLKDTGNWEMSGRLTYTPRVVSARPVLVTTIN